MDYSQHIFVLMSLTSIITSNTATLTPSGPTVSVDCGGQQTFTCSVTGVAATWIIAGLDGITVSGTNGVTLAGSSTRVTTTDSSGIVQTSTITIAGFTAADDGGTVQCVNQADNAVQGMTTVSVGVPSCPTNALVADRRSDFSSATITWDQPTNSPPVTSYDVTCNSSCTASMPCTSGSSTCRVLTVSRGQCEDYSVTVLPMNSCGSSTGCTENVVAVPSQGPPQCGQVGVDYGCDSCPSFTFTPQGNVQPSTVMVSYQLVGDPSSAGSLNCSYPVDSQMCRLVVPGGTYTVRATPQNSCGSPSSACSSFTEIITSNCTLANRLPTTTDPAPTVSILSGVIPSVILTLTNIITAVAVFLVTRHCYKKSGKGSSSSRREELYEQVEGKKVYEDINMTDSPAYGPTSPAPPVYICN